MNTIFLGIVIFLCVLAVFDLIVGVSNDAVNFLNSAIGAKVAKFKTIVLIAAIGVFAGAAMSNGMMDVARHGILTPEYFSFYEVMCVFLAVMVTDVILLDIFNTLGMPTSTTVSMVFELLGGAFAVALAIALAIYLLVRSNMSSNDVRRKDEDSLFVQILKSKDLSIIWKLLCEHIRRGNVARLQFVIDTYELMTTAFLARRV